MAFDGRLQLDLLITAEIVLLTVLLSSAQAVPQRSRKPMRVPSAALVPPRANVPKHFKGLEPSSSIYAPSFLPTPNPPTIRANPPSRGLTQPKKPVYHYTPIKPFSEEELGNGYRGKVPAANKNVGKGIHGYEELEDYLFQPTLRGVQGDAPHWPQRPHGPQVYELNTEGPPHSRPILPPKPIVPEPPVRVSATQAHKITHPAIHGGQTTALIPDTELLDIQNIRLGEAVNVGPAGTSAVVQRQNPAQSKYHFEYQVREPEGEYGHAEAKDGALTTGGYDVNLHKSHVQSVRYFVDSKEVPIAYERRYGYAYV